MGIPLSINPLPEDGLHALSKPAAFPTLESCYVMSIEGVIASTASLHAAITQGMITHSEGFIEDLVKAVRYQRPLDLAILKSEERLVRQAVENAGDEHGTSGFNKRVTWLSEKIEHLSCAPNLDPKTQGNSSVELRYFELHDPRAYRSTRLLIHPNRQVLGLGLTSILEKDPSYSFIFETNGLALWSSVLPMLTALCGNVPSKWEDFQEVSAFHDTSIYKGCFSACINNNLSLIIKEGHRSL